MYPPANAWGTPILLGVDGVCGLGGVGATLGPDVPLVSSSVDVIDGGMNDDIKVETKVDDIPSVASFWSGASAQLRLHSNNQ